MDNLLKLLLYSKVLGELHGVCRYTSTLGDINLF